MKLGLQLGYWGAQPPANAGELVAAAEAEVFDAVFAAWPLLLRGTWITIQLSALAMFFGLIVAIFCAWGKTAGPRPVR